MSQGTDIDSIRTLNEKPVKHPKFITAAYNIIGIIAGIGAIIYDKPNVVVILLFYPLLGVAIVLLSKGIIKLSSNDRPKILTSIYLGVFFAVMFMAFMAYDNYTILQIDHLWLPFALISIIMMSIFYKTSISTVVEKNKTDMVFVLLVSLTYAYGSTIQINCAFDSADVQIYNTVILSKHSYQGRHSSYYLTLAPWGPVQQIKQVEEEGLLYDQVKIGDTVKVNLKPGLLHIPWFIVTRY